MRVEGLGLPVPKAQHSAPNISGGLKGGMKVGGVKGLSPNIVESTIGIL